MRLFICLLLLFSTPSAFADDKTLRFGGQVSENSYSLTDPSGPTANGTGVSFGGLALYDLNRNGRMLANLTKESYKLTASTTNVGQDVSAFGASLSYQKMWRLTRDFKPWFGVGIGYSAMSFKNRHTLTPTGLFSVPLANRDTSEFALLLNTNSEWEIDHDFSWGVQGQFSSSSSAKSFRVGLYVIY